MRNVFRIIMLTVGSLLGVVAVLQAKAVERAKSEQAPRYRIPNEQRLSERRDQMRAIVKVFARRTSFDRAKQLALLCYHKTINSPFTPVDLAEIALAETGGHGLSGKAVSNRGALGVWQLMPVRARSHGYTPADMRDDAKCATAAVRELNVKLEMARGDLTLAKKYYCGVGPDADAYEQKRLAYRRELLLAMPIGDQDDSPFAQAQVARAY